MIRVSKLNLSDYYENYGRRKIPQYWICAEEASIVITDTAAQKFYLNDANRLKIALMGE
jgi:hypothetical protein